jgi:hypothetical protein
MRWVRFDRLIKALYCFAQALLSAPVPEKPAFQIGLISSGFYRSGVIELNLFLSAQGRLDSLSDASKIRQALRDSATHPRFVETVARLGYRFLADVAIGEAPGTYLVPKVRSMAVLPLEDLSGKRSQEYTQEPFHY